MPEITIETDIKKGETISVADVVASIADANGGYWGGEHPMHPFADWQYKVRNGDTRSGYWEWVLNRICADFGLEG